MYSLVECENWLRFPSQTESLLSIVIGSSGRIWKTEEH
jgi:hypothetical protein